MISFREYLNLNESIDNDYEELKKDNRKKILLGWALKNRKNPYTGLNHVQKDDVLKDINNQISDKNEEIENDEDKIAPYDSTKELDDEFKKIEEIIENKRFNKFGDIEKVSNDKTADVFFSSIKNEKERIQQLNKNDTEKVLKCFKDSNIDNDNKISKEEFINAVKKIKEEFTSGLEKPAVILWLLYLNQVCIEKQIEVFNKEDKQIPKTQTVAKRLGEPFFKQDKDKKQYIPTEYFEDLNNVFSCFQQFRLDRTVLQNFKNFNSSLNFLKNFDEKNVDSKIKGNFKKEDSNKKEEPKKETQQQNTDDEIDHSDDAELGLSDEPLRFKETEEEKNTRKAEEIIKKNKWYIYDVSLPSAGNNEELEKFIDFMKTDENGPIGKINTIKKELNSYKEKYGKDYLKTETDKQQIQKESIISKYINRQKTINEGLFSSFNIKDYEDKIEDLNTEYEKKLRNINNKIDKETNYTKREKLELEFKNLINDWGAESSKIIIKLKKDAEPSLEKIKDKKYRDSFDKTPEQKGQENLNIQSIKKIFIDPKYLNDSVEIAKYMLVNVLKERTDPKEVINILNAKNFQKIPYVYSGTSNFVYALNAKDVIVEEKIIGDTKLKTYSFNKGKVRIYKNPASLLNQLGVSIDSLTPEVLLAIKKDMPSEISQRASEYKTSSENLISTVKSIIGAKSIVTESFFDFGKTSNINPDKSLKNNIMSRLDQNQKNGGNLKETIESNCHPIDRTVIKKFDPKEESPEGIAIRQIFKGFVILDYSIDEKYAYITTEDAYNMKIKPAIDKEKAESKQLDPKNPNDVEEIAKNLTKSVVTTANADSTYGDGYGYNKKADAIKKKLNCTTYTYSPNSKMKIVRRTFD
jgi:hypothetical protein